MTFEDMFFKRREGHAFFQPNDGSPNNRAAWLATFEGREKVILANLIGKREKAGKKYPIKMCAQQTRTYGTYTETDSISCAVTFNVLHVYPSPAALSGIAALYQIDQTQMETVQQQYDQMLSEVIEFILRDPQFSKRALDELHAFYDPDVVVHALKTQKSLTYNPGFHSFDTDVHDYTQTMNLLLKMYFPLNNNKENKMESSLLDLYVLLIYQAMHPDVFQESLKEQATRYLSKACTFIFRALTLLSVAMLVAAPITISFFTLVIMFTEIFTAQLLLLFCLSTTFLIAEIYGISLLDSYLEKNSEYKDTFSYMSNHASNFFLSAFETLFNCKTYEFEMTRILEKGRAYILQEEAETDDSEISTNQSCHAGAPLGIF